ncbi:MAG TPA: adenylate kinase [Candidatus Margulisiibacteriota bacterium]|nr:adenylate kinase [Candidatus Margulisiibacteriota bacterium]
MRMILMGPPGAGKGTQATLLQERFDVPHISSGELLRSAVKRKTALGTQAKRFMDRGELVPDDILMGTIDERLRRNDCAKGFILDGFPRTVAQADALTAMLGKNGTRMDHVVSLTVPRDEVVKRLSGRRTCRDCGAMYHIIFEPSNNPGICNRCNGELYQRDDDQEDTILARLDVYDRQTAPLLALYRQQGLLREVDGIGSQDQVFARLLAAVQADA